MPCLRRALIGVGLMLAVVLPALAHDSWISRGGHRNGAGEWCCGDGDCFVVPSEHVRAMADGYHLLLRQVVDGKDVDGAEVVPYAETQPSPDGAYWRCKRPDGTRRCFFAPPPNT